MKFSPVTQTHLFLRTFKLHKNEGKKIILNLNPGWTLTSETLSCVHWLNLQLNPGLTLNCGLQRRTRRPLLVGLCSAAWSHSWTLLPPCGRIHKSYCCCRFLLKTSKWSLVWRIIVACRCLWVFSYLNLCQQFIIKKNNYKSRGENRRNFQKLEADLPWDLSDWQISVHPASWSNIR